MKKVVYKYASSRSRYSLKLVAMTFVEKESIKCPVIMACDFHPRSTGDTELSYVYRMCGSDLSLDCSSLLPLYYSSQYAGYSILVHGMMQY